MTVTTIKRTENLNPLDQIKPVGKLDDVKDVIVQDSNIGKALKDYDLIMNVDVSPNFHMDLFDFLSFRGSDWFFDDFDKWRSSRENAIGKIKEDEFVIPDDKVEAVLKSVPPVLTPKEIEKFSNIVSSGCENLKNFGNTGVYISSLISDSYREGMNNFEFEENNLDYLCSYLLDSYNPTSSDTLGKNPIRIKIGENHGFGLGYCSNGVLMEVDKNHGADLAHGGSGLYIIGENHGDYSFNEMDCWSVINIKKNFGNYLRLRTEYAKVFVGENHGLFLGEQLKKSELHIGEENTAFTGRLASNCVFRSPNKHTLDLLKADPKKGNKFYLLNNDKATEYFPKKIKS